MERKKKIRRVFTLIISLYIILNILIFGMMNAYMETNNVLSKNQLVMVSVTENVNKTNIEILGKNFEIDKNNTAKTIVQACTYTLMPEKIRVCTDVILTFRNIVKNELLD